MRSMMYQPSVDLKNKKIWIFPSTVDRCKTGMLIRNESVHTETGQSKSKILQIKFTFDCQSFNLLDITVGIFHSGFADLWALSFDIPK